MSQLIYRHDRSLTIVTLVLGVSMWALVAYALAKVGGAQSLLALALAVMLFSVIGFLGYLFARSAAIALLRGNGIELSDAQFPELHAQFSQCCDRLSIRERPHIYIRNGNGVLNAFATWFLGRKFVVLLSGVVDAMDENPNGVRFYVGHELGHILRHDNPIIWVLRRPALLLPLLGAAFSRARESTCDLHGLTCSDSREGAARSLVALSAGAARWKRVSFESLRAQLNSTKAFWASFHELTASYPWTSKRVMRVLHEKPEIPRRNPFAYILAAFVPYAGRLGSGLGFFLYVYVIGVLAAIAIPAYQNYAVRATLAEAMAVSQPARDALTDYYIANGHQPDSLASVGISENVATGITLSLGQGMNLAVQSTRGALVFSPLLDKQGRLVWGCSGGPGVRAGQLPPGCQ